ncbi:MAG: hypothetical protein M1820_007607 [Bogoriella megaspora]|nr:MAG: hypothetical protein M1820_007607 [Bogoriella megaspora]
MSTLRTLRVNAARAPRAVQPPPKSRDYTGVVVSAGKMQKTVKVRIVKQQWNAHIRKHFHRPIHYLTHDPASSVREGDIIKFQSGYRCSKHVRHVVTQIIAPFGPSLDARPPVPSLAELQIEEDAKKERKEERKKLRATIKNVEGRIRNIEEGLRTGTMPTGSTGAQKEVVREDGVIEGSGGLHHVGKINERARHNRGKEMRETEKGVRNEEALERVTRKLEDMSLSGREVGGGETEEALKAAEQGKSEEEMRAEKEDDGSESAASETQKKRGWFGWR